MNISISKDIENNCPQFKQLLEKLAERLDSSGRTKETQRDYEVVKEKMERARKKYLETSVRVEILKELITNYELKSLTNPGFKHEAALVDILKGNLTLAEVSCMIHLGDIKGVQVTTLGLDPEDVKTKTPRTGAGSGPELGQQLLPLVEDLLFSKCLSLLVLLEPELETDKPRVILHPCVMRLADKVAELVNTNQFNDQELSEMGEEWRKSFQDQASVLERIVNNVEVLIKQYFCGSFTANNVDIVKNFSVEIESLMMKVRNMTLDVENNLYTGDNVQALKKIRNTMVKQSKELESKISSTRTLLDQYQKCGPEMSDIVNEVARVQKEIETKKWALAQFPGQT